MNEITWNLAYSDSYYGEPILQRSMSPVADMSQGSEDVTFSLASAYSSSLIETDEGLQLTLMVLAQSTTNLPGYLEVYNTSTLPYVDIAYEDVEQLPPTPSYPVDMFLKEGEAVLFAWQWNSQTPAVQQNYQLEYKEVSDENYTVVTGGAEHSYLLPAGLPAGNV